MGSQSVPSVSVVIPTRNRLALLKEAVASVQHQTNHDWELIIVDDASDDGTGKWLRTIDDRRLRVLTFETARERSAARNAGATEAAAPFLFFLDDDDLFMPTTLEDSLRAANRCPEAVAVAGGWEYFGRWSGRPGWPRRDWAGWVFRDCSYAMPLGGPGVLFRAAAFWKTGGFPTDLHQAEDAILAIRISGQGPFSIVGKRLYRVRTRASHGWEEHEFARADARIAAEITQWCPPHLRQELKGLVTGAQSWRRGQKHLRLGERLDAMRCFATAAIGDPAVLRAPLLRTCIFPGVIRGLLPPRLRSAARAGKGLLHRASGSRVPRHQTCR